MQAQAKPWIPGERFLEAGQDISGLRKDSFHTAGAAVLGGLGVLLGKALEFCWVHSDLGGTVVTTADSEHSHWGSRQMLVWAI